MGRGWERALFLAFVLETALATIYAGAAFALDLRTGLFALATFGWFPLATFLVWWHVRRRRLGKEPLGSAPPLPAPVAVLDADATDEVAVMAEVEGSFTCCPRCGYLGIRAPTIRDGLWPGGGETSARMVCGRCHYQGLPLEFDDGDAYAAFVKGLNAGAP